MKRGILIKRKEDGLQLEMNLVEIAPDKSELQQMYDLLNVNLIDVVSYKGLSIIVDDEGLLKGDPKLTLQLLETNQNLYGNILILGDVDDNGDTLGVTEKDIKLLNDARLLIEISSGMQVLAM